MKYVKDLMNMTLNELMENFVVVENLECGYYYGIVSVELVEKIFDEYDIEKEYPEAFDVQNIIRDEIVVDFGEKILDYNRLEKIMNNLGVSKK